MAINDLHEEIRGIGGIPGLWLSVVFDAVLTIHAGPEAQGYKQARNFIMEPGGMFEAFCTAIDCNAHDLRRLIEKEGGKSNGN